MHPLYALTATRMVSTVVQLESGSEIPYGTVTWFVYAGISCLLVIFAGLMSGLTLGLMSLSLVDLEILQRSGSDAEKKQSGFSLSLCCFLLLFDSVMLSLRLNSFPLYQKQHQLLVTLLLCNAASMEALPIYLDKMFNQYVAIILSVTFVLFFGEVIPQAICSRYGLAVGANLAWLVRLLMIICYPISFPLGKILDYVLGHNEPLFRRAQLKALVSIHSKEAGKGGELTHDETTIIAGALDLTEKTAEEAMTPIESTFSLDVNSKLDWEAIGKVLARGHSRVPVYSGNPKNIIGLLLVKALLTVRPETETPVSAVSIRRIPRVPSDMPLYDILNEFQKGSSHMAAVVRAKGKSRTSLKEASRLKGTDLLLTTPLLYKVDEAHDDDGSIVVDIDRFSKVAYGVPLQSEAIENGEVIGIITLEDVFEELLQEEIVDETDEYIDVHNRVRVVAAAAASLMARVPSSRRLLTANKGAGSQGRTGPTPRKGDHGSSSLKFGVADATPAEHSSVNKTS
ncbi:DUF21 domain-containing protein At4g14230 [Linum perenne]